MTPTNADHNSPTGAAHGGAHKLWGGRFAGGPHPALEAVNRSITVDFRLWPFDIQLSKGWALALAKAGVFTTAECDAVRAGLDTVAARLAAGDEALARVDAQAAVGALGVALVALLRQHRANAALKEVELRGRSSQAQVPNPK